MSGRNGGAAPYVRRTPSPEVPILDAVPILLVAMLALLNAWATWRVVRDDLSSPGQRVAQAALIWVIPFVGALVVVRLIAGPTGRDAGRPADGTLGDTYGYGSDVGGGWDVGGSSHGGGGHG